MKALMLTVATVGVFAQCKPRPTVSTAPPSALPAATAPSLPTADFTVSDLTADGYLIFWSMDAFDHIEPFDLRGDFGVLLYNAGNGSKPVAGYVLAIQATRTIVHTTDFQTFRDTLAKVPRGSSIARYETCSVPRAYGLPEKQVSKFLEALSEAALQVKGESVCYCPNRN